MKPIFCAVLWATCLMGPLAAQGSDARITVRYATSDQVWAPFRTEDSRGRQVGLVPDLLDLLLARTLGFQYEIHPLPWARAQEMVSRGDLDFTITLATPTRLQWAVASTSRLYSIYFKLYVRARHPRLAEIQKVRTLEDVKALGLTVASNGGNNWTKTEVEGRGIPVHYLQNDEAIVRFVEAGRADIAIDSPFSLGPRIAELGLAGKVVETEARFDEVWFQILWSKRSPLFPLWPTIDKAISSMVDSDEYRALLHRHLGE